MDAHTEESSANEEDVDIYSNLPNFHYDESLQKLEGENKILHEKISGMKDEIIKLTAQLSITEKEKGHLAANISSLYLSAKHEITRKDKLIAELRASRNGRPTYLMQRTYNSSGPSRQNEETSDDETRNRSRELDDKRSRLSNLSSHQDLRSKYSNRSLPIKKTDNDKPSKSMEAERREKKHVVKSSPKKSTARSRDRKYGRNMEVVEFSPRKSAARSRARRYGRNMEVVKYSPKKSSRSRLWSNVHKVIKETNLLDVIKQDSKGVNVSEVVKKVPVDENVSDDPLHKSGNLSTVDNSSVRNVDDVGNNDDKTMEHLEKVQEQCESTNKPSASYEPILPPLMGPWTKFSVRNYKKIYGVSPVKPGHERKLKAPIVQQVGEMFTKDHSCVDKNDLNKENNAKNYICNLSEDKAKELKRAEKDNNHNGQIVQQITTQIEEKQVCTELNNRNTEINMTKMITDLSDKTIKQHVETRLATENKHTVMGENTHSKNLGGIIEGLLKDSRTEVVKVGPKRDVMSETISAKTNNSSHKNNKETCAGQLKITETDCPEPKADSEICTTNNVEVQSKKKAVENQNVIGSATSLQKAVSHKFDRHLSSVSSSRKDMLSVSTSSTEGRNKKYEIEKKKRIEKDKEELLSSSSQVARVFKKLPQIRKNFLDLFGETPTKTDEIQMPKENSERRVLKNTANDQRKHNETVSESSKSNSNIDVVSIDPVKSSVTKVKDLDPKAIIESNIEDKSSDLSNSTPSVLRLFGINVTNTMSPFLSPRAISHSTASHDEFEDKQISSNNKELKDEFTNDKDLKSSTEANKIISDLIKSSISPKNSLDEICSKLMKNASTEGEKAGEEVVKGNSELSESQLNHSAKIVSSAISATQKSNSIKLDSNMLEKNQIKDDFNLLISIMPLPQNEREPLKPTENSITKEQHFIQTTTAVTKESTNVITTNAGNYSNFIEAFKNETTVNVTKTNVVQEDFKFESPSSVFKIHTNSLSSHKTIENTESQTLGEDTMNMLRAFSKVEETISPLKTPCKPMDSSNSTTPSKQNKLEIQKTEQLEVVQLQNKNSFLNTNELKGFKMANEQKQNVPFVFKKDGVSVSVSSEHCEFKRRRRTKPVIKLNGIEPQVSVDNESHETKQNDCKRMRLETKISKNEETTVEASNLKRRRIVVLNNESPNKVPLVVKGNTDPKFKLPNSLQKTRRKDISNEVPKVSTSKPRTSSSPTQYDDISRRKEINQRETPIKKLNTIHFGINRKGTSEFINNVCERRSPSEYFNRRSRQTRLPNSLLTTFRRSTRCISPFIKRKLERDNNIKKNSMFDNRKPDIKCFKKDKVANLGKFARANDKEKTKILNNDKNKRISENNAVCQSANATISSPSNKNTTEVFKEWKLSPIKIDAECSSLAKRFVAEEKLPKFIKRVENVNFSEGIPQTTVPITPASPTSDCNSLNRILVDQTNHSNQLPAVKRQLLSSDTCLKSTDFPVADSDKLDKSTLNKIVIVRKKNRNSPKILGDSAGTFFNINTPDTNQRRQEQTNTVVIRKKEAVLSSRSLQDSVGTFIPAQPKPMPTATTSRTAQIVSAIVQRNKLKNAENQTKPPSKTKNIEKDCDKTVAAPRRTRCIVKTPLDFKSRFMKTRSRR